MARTRTNTQINTKHVEYQDVTDNQKKIILCVSDFTFTFYEYFLMISPSNVELSPWNGQ